MQVYHLPKVHKLQASIWPFDLSTAWKTLPNNSFNITIIIKQWNSTQTLAPKDCNDTRNKFEIITSFENKSKISYMQMR